MDQNGHRERVETQSLAFLKDVSKAAGVSASTVSRVITGTRHVEEETRERVLEAMPVSTISQ